MCSDILVHPALQVSELALHGIVASAAAAYLVGHKDVGRVVRGEAVKLLLGHSKRLVNILVVNEKIGQPQGHAVDDCHTPCQVMAAQIAFLLDVGPLRATSLLMTAHTFTELLVPDVRGGDIDGIVAQVQSQPLGLCALARPLPAGY